jgi:cell division septation protein DedD
LTIDYAKKAPQPPTRSRRLWLIALVILGLILAIPALIYVHYMHMPHFHNKNIKIKPLTPHQQKKITQAQPTPQQQYDFYSMLPKMYVAVKEGNPAAVQIPVNQPYYLLQISTSSNHDAAERLITKLGVMGLNAFTKTAQSKNGKIQYRILAGPYLNNKSAATDQAYLKTNHINSIKLKTTNYLK